MDKSDERYGCYVAILEEELVCAMGCTEPIAIAYAAARARELLGARPDRLAVSACGSIIKNAKSVVVPHTGGLKGIEAAAAASIPLSPPVWGTTTLFAFLMMLPHAETARRSGRAPSSSRARAAA